MEACTRTVRWFTYKNSSGGSSDFLRKFIYSLQILSYFCYNDLMSCTYAIDWSAMFLICHAWIFYCPGTGVVRGRWRQDHSICRTFRNSCYSDNKRNHWCLASEYNSNHSRPYRFSFLTTIWRRNFLMNFFFVGKKRWKCDRSFKGIWTRSSKSVTTKQTGNSENKSKGFGSGRHCRSCR